MRAAIVHRALQLVAFSAIGILALITLFIFREGTPVLVKTGVGSFLGGTEWHPLSDEFGIAPMIVGSAMVTLGSLVIGVPPAIACAIVLAELAPARVRTLLKPTIELLAGIPSVRIAGSTHIFPSRSSRLRWAHGGKSDIG